MPRCNVLLPVLGCLLAASASAQPLDSLAIAWERVELPNGLEVVLAPDSTMSEVSVEWWNAVGTRHEPPGLFGLAHFFEHAMPWGSGLLRSDTLAAQFQEALTGSNARTRPDLTRYYLQSAPGDLDFLLIATADRLKSDPVEGLTERRVEYQRERVYAEIQRSEGRRWGWPVAYARRLGTFGAGHPYGHTGYGSDAETAAVAIDDLVRWQRAHVRPEYTTLFVVGPFDPARVLELIRHQFGSIPGGVRPPRARPPEVPEATPGRIEVDIPADRGLVVTSWPTAPWASADGALLPLAVRILNERMEGNLPEGATDGGAEGEWFAFAGEVTTVAVLGSEADPEPAERWIRRHVAALTREGVTTDELARAQEAELALVRHQLGRPGWMQSRTDLLGFSLHYAGSPDAYLERLSRQLQATPESVRVVAWRWLRGPGYTVVATGLGEPATP